MRLMIANYSENIFHSSALKNIICSIYTQIYGIVNIESVGINKLNSLVNVFEIC